MRYVGPFGRGAAILMLVFLGGLRPALAQTVDPSLQGRIFQTGDGGLWIYKDGARYPVVGVELSEGQIDAIPSRVDRPVERLDALFLGSASPAPEDLGPTAAAPQSMPPALVLDVSNPQANESVPPSFHMSGVAYDPLAEAGTGVDRVTVFVEDRDSGGVNVGEAVFTDPGFRNGWDARVTLPVGPHTLFIYAHSAITGREAIVTIPVRVGP